MGDFLQGSHQRDHHKWMPEGAGKGYWIFRDEHYGNGDKADRIGWMNPHLTGLLVVSAPFEYRD
jgi:hypothetical protein